MKINKVIKDILKRWFTKENIKLEIIAAFIAVLLWLTVTFNQRALRFVNIPLELKVSYSSYIVNSIPDNIKVYLTGQKDLLHSVSASNMKIQVDLEGKMPGTYNYNIKDILELPDGISVLKTIPQRVTFMIEEKKEK